MNVHTLQSDALKYPVPGGNPPTSAKEASEVDDSYMAKARSVCVHMFLVCVFVCMCVPLEI